MSITSGSTTIGSTTSGVGGINGSCEAEEEDAVALSPRNKEKGDLMAALAFFPGR
jgi:hypothetical protein